jgi:aspartate/methionine/tyrosine aminotransferase
MADAVAAAVAAIDTDRLVELVTQVCRIPSVLGEEGPLAEFLHDVMKPGRAPERRRHRRGHRGLRGLRRAGPDPQGVRMPPALGSRPATAPSFEALLQRPGLAWMGQNTTHLEPPLEVVAALLDSTRRHEFQFYAPALGFDELRALIVADLGLASSGSIAMITDGAVGGLHHVCTALAPGLSRLITTDPGWPWPGRFVRAQGVPVTAVGVYCDQAGYKLTAAALAEVIEPRSLLYLIDPLNPLGSSYRRDELAARVDLARANDAIVVHDCTYRHFADGHTLAAELYPRAR